LSSWLEQPADFRGVERTAINPDVGERAAKEITGAGADLERLVSRQVVPRRVESRRFRDRLPVNVKPQRTAMLYRRDVMPARSQFAIVGDARTCFE
jgi:hypothetical protein